MATIEAQLASRPVDKNVLVNIPIWGWTGDGKTCALLTAIHYSDASRHPLGLALVDNPDELVAVETSADEYRGLNLVGAAAATTERLRGLAEEFIDANGWPPGTDEPSTYVLAVRNVSATLGYALFPDIKGGSFREIDETARDVLRRAHAAVLLVSPERYQAKTTEGKRYRDDILARLQQFAEAQIPVCVMITKADLHQGQHQATDRTHEELTVVVSRQNGLNALLCRVSVIGLDRELVGEKPPPASDRNPDSLVRAWIWVIAQALLKPAKDIRGLLPSLNIRTVGEHATPVSFEPIPELRQIGDFSTSPGPVLCASSDDPRTLAVAFISKEGELIETPLDVAAANQEPQFRTIGTVPEWAGAAVVAHYIGGEFLIGPRTQCNFLWQGAKGGALAKIPLPYEMVSWAPVAARRLVAIDSAGRIHSLIQEGGKWVQRDYVEHLISASPTLACAFAESSSHALAYNGTAVAGASLAPDGRFGPQVSASLVGRFDTPRTETNRLGFCIAMNQTGQVTLSAPEKPTEMGPAKADVPFPFALAPYAPLAAIVGPDLRLSAVLATGAQTIKTRPSSSPTLQANPSAMIWTRKGEVLVVSFTDGTWQVFRPLGLLG